MTNTVHKTLPEGGGSQGGRGGRVGVVEVNWWGSRGRGGGGQGGGGVKGWGGQGW